VKGGTAAGAFFPPPRLHLRGQPPCFHLNRERLAALVATLWSSTFSRQQEPGRSTIGLPEGSCRRPYNAGLSSS